MNFNHSDSGHQCSGCCPECTVTSTPHCAHCPQYGRTIAETVPMACDYSHLVDVGVRRQDNVFDAAGFDGLLTDYDRMLLGFGMHISWQL